MNSIAISNKKLTCDTIILFMGLFYPALNNYFWRVIVGVTRIFGIDFTNDLFNAVVWTLVIAYVILSAKKIVLNAKTLLCYISFILITLFSYLFTSYDYFSPSVLVMLAVGTLSFFLQGSLISIDRVTYKYLYIMAIITLSVSMLYSVYFLNKTDVTLEDNMDFAYKVLPSVLIIVSKLFTKEKKKIAVLFSVLGMIFLLLQGTRGPLLCLAAFVCLMLFKKHGFGKMFVGFGAAVVVASLLLTSPMLKLKALDLSEKIDSSGFSSRVILMMIEGEISDDNGRDAIQDALLDGLKESPLKVRGLFSDRQATQGLVDQENNTKYENGTYAHSLWLEFLYNYGIIFGSILLAMVVFLIFRLIKKCSVEDSYMVMLFVCTGFMHLFLSGSYLRSSEFFFLIGLALNYKPKTVIKRDTGVLYENSAN